MEELSCNINYTFYLCPELQFYCFNFVVHTQKDIETILPISYFRLNIFTKYFQLRETEPAAVRRGGAGAHLQREGRELGVTQLLQQRPPHQVPLRQPGDGELCCSACCCIFVFFDFTSFDLHELTSCVSEGLLFE